MPLTDKQCKAAMPREKVYRLNDGDSLALVVRPDGGKYWRMRYRFAGKEQTASFGVYPKVSLLEARRKRDDAKRDLERGLKPEGKIAKRVLSHSPTFLDVATRWHGKWKGTVTEQTAKEVWVRLERDVFPIIGNKPIAHITAPEMLALFELMEKRGIRETVHRCCQKCDSVFTFALGLGLVDRNPAKDVRGLLAGKKRGHFAAFHHSELPQFFQVLQVNERRLHIVTRLMILALCLTFVRPSELRLAKKTEGMGDTWEIPAERMKRRRPHIVPLSPQAQKVFAALRFYAGKSEWLLPSPYGTLKPVSEGTANVAIKRMGYHGRMTSHGFRAVARTAIRELRIETDSRVLELQLAHAEKNLTLAAYDRTELLEERRAMMCGWSDWLETQGLPLSIAEIPV